MCTHIPFSKACHVATRDVSGEESHSLTGKQVWWEGASSSGKDHRLSQHLTTNICFPDACKCPTRSLQSWPPASNPGPHGGTVSGPGVPWPEDLPLNRSVQFSHSVVSNSLQPHESQHARPPCLSPTPGVYPNSCPLSR